MTEDHNQQLLKKKGMGRSARTTVLAAVLILAVTGLAIGVSSYMSTFNSRYGTSGTALNSCTVCHPSGGYNLNPYARDWANNNRDYAAVEGLDSDGDGFSNLAEITARTFPGDAASHPVSDATPPVVGTFTIPATSSSLVVTISALTATDNVAVTGYMVTETAQKPLATASGWTATRPASYSFTTAGGKTLYAWAKDAAGNVSTTVKSATVTIALADTTPPVVSAFVLPATSNSLTVAISTFTVTDNTGVTAYFVAETSTKPASTDPGWTATRPASYSFTSAGTKTLYAWARDGAGNISTSAASAAVTITLSDTIPPVVTGFVMPATYGSLNVPITTFTASDNVGVTGYAVTETATKPAASDPGWTATPTLSHTFATVGTKILYGWAKDGAGNISSTPASQTVTVTEGDTTPPFVTNFLLPAETTTLKVPILALAAQDDIAVTGFLITESVDYPAPTATGWTATPPASYTFTSEGVKALYAWVKDAAGNVSEPWSDMVYVVITDTTPPDVMDFTLPATSANLVVPVQKFVAIDDLEVTGYMITRTSSRPAAGATGWSATPQTSYTFPAGSSGTQTLYAWAKDAAGNVSDYLTEQVTLESADTTRPVVTRFSIPSRSGSLTVPIQRFTGTDNKVVAGYMVTTTSTKPSWSATGWTAAPPASYTFTSGGTKTLYPWVRDGSGNVSNRYSGSSMTVRISVRRDDDERDDDD